MAKPLVSPKATKRTVGDKCPTCTRARLQRLEMKLERHAFGVLFTTNVGALRCVHCQARFVEASVVRFFREAVAVSVADHGPLSGETLDYLRRSLRNMTAAKLAKELGVRKETFSRWKTGAERPSVLAWCVVAAIVVEQFSYQEVVWIRVRDKRMRKRLAFILNPDTQSKERHLEVDWTELGYMGHRPESYEEAAKARRKSKRLQKKKNLPKMPFPDDDPGA